VEKKTLEFPLTGKKRRGEARIQKLAGAVWRKEKKMPKPKEKGVGTIERMLKVHEEGKNLLGTVTGRFDEAWGQTFAEEKKGGGGILVRDLKKTPAGKLKKTHKPRKTTKKKKKKKEQTKKKKKNPRKEKGR